MMLSWAAFTLVIFLSRHNERLFCNAVHRTLVNHDQDHTLLRLLPKVELHAHLHGSIRRSTLLELSSAKNLSLDCDWDKDSNDCFRLFGVVHSVISSKEVLRRIVREVTFQPMPYYTTL
jgi:hypothetical protein